MPAVSNKQGMQQISTIFIILIFLQIPPVITNPVCLTDYQGNVVERKLEIIWLAKSSGFTI